MKQKKGKIKKAAVKTQIPLEPTEDRVLIKESVTDAQEKTQSGILLPQSGDKDSGAKRGRVVATGPGKFDNGARVPMSVSTGDTVLFQWGEKVVINSEEYYIVRASEILGIVN